MKNLNSHKYTWWLVVVMAILASWLPCRQASAQLMQEPPQRWLLVFETSIAMKNWLPATTTELQNLFVHGMGGHLHEGDSVGVWTFGKKLRAADYPLQTWISAKASSASSDLVSYLNNARYLGRGRLGDLRPDFQHVIAGSQRLTIVIFCDGLDNLKLTPYDTGINGTFKKVWDGRIKPKAPFVVVIRTQNGQFVGATVNLPPGALDIPAFPALPQPAQPAMTTPAEPATATAAPAPPVVVPPPLVIVGTNIVTNPATLKKDEGQ